MWKGRNNIWSNNIRVNVFNLDYIAGKRRETLETVEKERRELEEVRRKLAVAEREIGKRIEGFLANVNLNDEVISRLPQYIAGIVDDVIRGLGLEKYVDKDKLVSSIVKQIKTAYMEAVSKNTNKAETDEKFQNKEADTNVITLKEVRKKDTMPNTPGVITESDVETIVSRLNETLAKKGLSQPEFTRVDLHEELEKLSRKNSSIDKNKTADSSNSVGETSSQIPEYYRDIAVKVNLNHDTLEEIRKRIDRETDLSKKLKLISRYSKELASEIYSVSTSLKLLSSMLKSNKYVLLGDTGEKITKISNRIDSLLEELSHETEEIKKYHSINKENYSEILSKLDSVYSRLKALESDIGKLWELIRSLPAEPEIDSIALVIYVDSLTGGNGLFSSNISNKLVDIYKKDPNEAREILRLALSKIVKSPGYLDMAVDKVMEAIKYKAEGDDFKAGATYFMAKKTISSYLEVDTLATVINAPYNFFDNLAEKTDNVWLKALYRLAGALAEGVEYAAVSTATGGVGLAVLTGINLARYTPDIVKIVSEGKTDVILKYFQEDPTRLIPILVPLAIAGGKGLSAIGRKIGEIRLTRSLTKTASRVARAGLESGDLDKAVIRYVAGKIWKTMTSRNILGKMRLDIRRLYYTKINKILSLRLGARAGNILIETNNVLPYIDKLSKYLAEFRYHLYDILSFEYSLYVARKPGIIGKAVFNTSKLAGELLSKLKTGVREVYNILREIYTERLEEKLSRLLSNLDAELINARSIGEIRKIFEKYLEKISVITSKTREISMKIDKLFTRYIAERLNAVKDILLREIYTDMLSKRVLEFIGKIKKYVKPLTGVIAEKVRRIDVKTLKSRLAWRRGGRIYRLQPNETEITIFVRNGKLYLIEKDIGNLVVSGKITGGARFQGLIQGNIGNRMVMGGMMEKKGESIKFISVKPGSKPATIPELPIPDKPLIRILRKSKAGKLLYNTVMLYTGGAKTDEAIKLARKIEQLSDTVYMGAGLYVGVGDSGYLFIPGRYNIYAVAVKGDPAEALHKMMLTGLKDVVEAIPIDEAGTKISYFIRDIQSKVGEAKISRIIDLTDDTGRSLTVKIDYDLSKASFNRIMVYKTDISKLNDIINKLEKLKYRYPGKAEDIDKIIRRLRNIARGRHGVVVIKSSRSSRMEFNKALEKATDKSLENKIVSRIEETSKAKVGSSGNVGSGGASHTYSSHQSFTGHTSTIQLRVDSAVLDEIIETGKQMSNKIYVSYPLVNLAVSPSRIVALMLANLDVIDKLILPIKLERMSELSIGTLNRLGMLEAVDTGVEQVAGVETIPRIEEKAVVKQNVKAVSRSRLKFRPALFDFGFNIYIPVDRVYPYILTDVFDHKLLRKPRMEYGEETGEGGSEGLEYEVILI